jgi:hypothetical protein
VYDELYPLYRKLYFELGQPGKGSLGDVLPALIKATERVRAASAQEAPVGAR